MLTRALPLFSLAVFAGAATVRFDPSDRTVGPFPSDALTVADTAQKTGRRVNLPMPDCATQASTCQEFAYLNQLDGFNLRPRVSIRFSGPIHPDTLRGGVFLVALDNLSTDEYGLYRTGDVGYIDQVIFDPDTNTAYAKTDAILDQHRQFLLVVTDAVRDRAGMPVTADPAYTACVTNPATDYCRALAPYVATAQARLPGGQVVAASLFTTMSATAWMESARAQLETSLPGQHPIPGTSAVPVSGIAGIVWHRQTGVNPPAFSDLTLPVSAALLQGIGRIAFGAYSSPRFLGANLTIAPQPSLQPVALPSESNEIPYTVYLPDSPKPSGGYPVVIFGHGLGDSRLGGPTAVAMTFAQAGFATLAITAMGHGYGPQSTIVLIDRSGNRLEVPAGGRGLDIDGDGKIGASEGCILPTGAGTMRDCLRQTALDLAQLTRAVRSGIDVDGDGSADLDASSIFYTGESLGTLYGTIFHALEPSVRAAALNVGGGSVVDLARWSPSYHALTAALLAVHQPAVLNKGADFDENYVLRWQPGKVNTVPGAIAIQNLFEIFEWMDMTGDPIAYAPHLWSSTLPGVPLKPTLWQIARGDRTVPNPASSSLIRAANMRQWTWMYRHDTALTRVPSLPADPHSFLALFLSLEGDKIELPGLQGLAISYAAQQQIAGYFKTGGMVIPNPNPVVRLVGLPDLFEVPAELPEDLGFAVPVGEVLPE